MYEKPNLTCVGAAQNVILGILMAGADMDGSYMGSSTEWPDDEMESAD